MINNVQLAIGQLSEYQFVCRKPDKCGTNEHLSDTSQCKRSCFSVQKWTNERSNMHYTNREQSVVFAFLLVFLHQFNFILFTFLLLHSIQIHYLFCHDVSVLSHCPSDALVYRSVQLCCFFCQLIFSHFLYSSQFDHTLFPFH